MLKNNSKQQQYQVGNVVHLEWEWASKYIYVYRQDKSIYANLNIRSRGTYLPIVNEHVEITINESAKTNIDVRVLNRPPQAVKKWDTEM